MAMSDSNSSNFNSKSDSISYSSLKGKSRELQEQLIQIRRDRVYSLWSRGWSQRRIAAELKCNQGTIYLDINWLMSQSKQDIQQHLEKGIPEYYTKCKKNLEDVLSEAWDIHESQNHQDNVKISEKVAILSLIKDTSRAITELSNNAGVVSQAIEFVKKANNTVNKYRDADTDSDNIPDDVPGAVDVPATVDDGEASMSAMCLRAELSLKGAQQPQQQPSPPPGGPPLRPVK